MACSKYVSTPEKTRAARVSRLVVDPCTDLFRDILRDHVTEIQFPAKLQEKRSKLSTILNKVQRDLLYPNTGSFQGTYEEFDLSLLYALLRNVTNIPPHRKGWAKTPHPSDRSLSANIDRIREVRNTYCGHAANVSMPELKFNALWHELTGIIGDLESSLPGGCTTYTDAANQIKTDAMDPEMEKKYLDQIDEQHRSIEDLKGRMEETSERVEKLDDKMEKMTDSVIPPNVREQYDIDIQKWQEEDKLYYETHSFPQVMERVRNQPCVTFVGVPGSGKSAMAHHIALKLQEEGYEVVPTKDVRKMEDYGDPRNPQVFVIDDVVGVFGLQETELNVLTKYEQKITKPCMVNSRTLISCREAVFNETVPYKPFFTKEETVIKLHSSDHILDDKDKKQILQKYGLNEDLMSPALLKSTSHMFPLLCKLFSKETKFQALGYKFFQNPVQCIIDQLDDMQRHNKLNYATLVLCLLNENSLSKDILNNKHFINMILNVLENCRLEHSTDTFKFMDALSAMEGSYTKQSGAQYTFIHDSMFEICAYHYGQQFPNQMLLYMSSSYIANYVKPQKSEPGIAKEMEEKQSDSQSCKGDKSSNDSDRKKESDDKSNKSDDKNNEREESFDLCIRLCEDQYPRLAERLYRDIQNLELYDVFRNPVVKHPQVSQAFIGVLETKSYTELKSLFLSSHGEVDKVVSKKGCVARESEEMGDELIRQWVLVDQRCKPDDKGEISYKSTSNVRVISWVMYYGHHQIIKYIIQQTEQHNQTSELCEITRNSPDQSKSGISSSCNEQESENNRVVEQSKSGIFNKIIHVIFSKRQKKEEKLCTHNEQTLQHEKICENNRVVEQCRLLVLSCYSGDVQTVRVVLPVCKRAINGIGQFSEGIDWYYHTPLTAACEGGHADIVKVLVKVGAGVNLQDRWGNTPLIAACKGGHVSVVKELVKVGADVNLQSTSVLGNTPLIAACNRGHVSVVKELVKVGADVNLQDRWGNTPLIAACEGGHLSVVKELVKVGADVNLQNTSIFGRRGNTPLIAAVRNCSLSTVKYLVEHGADWVTQVVDVKVSAVYTALILNKPDIVKYLIQQQNKIIPGQFTGNVHLFNCLVDIRHAGVKTDSRDDVVTDRSVWCMDEWGDLWKTIKECDVLRHLLCVGLDVNQSIQLYNDKSNVRPLLYSLVDEELYVKHRTEKVSILLGAGADVNARVWCREYDSVLDREGVSVVERTRRRVCKYSEIKDRLHQRRVPEYKEVMCEIKKHVRRHSV